VAGVGPKTGVRHEAEKERHSKLNFYEVKMIQRSKELVGKYIDYHIMPCRNLRS
jgi:hypothetical protein